ncbi:MAG: ABC transporter ATP-binding protein [Sedimentibacter sp.]
MNEVLRIEALTKKYYNKTALENINLTFMRGKIYGLLGPNGSGKTTLMKTIMGLHKQTSGEVFINDNPLSFISKSKISYMPTEDFLYDTFKVKHAVKFYADMYDDFKEEYAYKILRDIQVEPDFKISKLSSGLNGKLKVALALSRDVDLYMLDEPLNGVDVLSRDTIIGLITKCYDEKKSFIVSTHLVSEIEKNLDSVIFLKEGKVALFGEAEELRLTHGTSIEGIYKEVYKNV